MQPIKLEENFGMAIISIQHGSIHNITANNQEIVYEVKLKEDIGNIMDGNIPIPGNDTYKIVTVENILKWKRVIMVQL